MNKFGLVTEYESQPPGGTANVIKIMVLEINSTLKGIRKHHNDFLGDQRGQGVTSSIYLYHGHIRIHL